MRRKVPLSTQLYNILFPFRTEGVDPSSFSEHVRKHLLPELRAEVRMFYGEDLSDTLEARFPGLDYNNHVHRLRLSRFPHHTKLFLAFSKLGWTEQEIYNFCDWEGTLLIKKRYEKYHGEIRDTAVDYVHHEDKPKPTLTLHIDPRGGPSAIYQESVQRHVHNRVADEQEEDDVEEHEDVHTAVTARSDDQQSAQSATPDPQSTLNFARQDLIARSRPAAAHLSSSLRPTLFRDREPPGPTTPSRPSRVESARAAA